jgi:hypothetical protein
MLFGCNRSEDDEKRPARSRRGKSKRANLKEESSSESEKESSSRDRRKAKDFEKEKESEEDVEEDETPPSSDEDVSFFLKCIIGRLLSGEEYYVMVLRVVAKNGDEFLLYIYSMCI